MKKSNFSKGLTKFWILTVLTLVITIADISLTFIGTPDLSKESNPLVYTAGLGWGALITANIIITILFIGLYYYSFVRFKPPIIKCNGFKEFYSIINFNQPDKFIWTLYKMPKNRIAYSYLLACGGFLTALVSILRIRAVLEWIGILTNSEFAYSYFRLIQNISFVTPIGRFDMILFLLFPTMFACFYWYYKQYRINKNALKNKNNNLAVPVI